MLCFKVTFKSIIGPDDICMSISRHEWVNSLKMPLTLICRGPHSKLFQHVGHMVGGGRKVGGQRSIIVRNCRKLEYQDTYQRLRSSRETQRCRSAVSGDRPWTDSICMHNKKSHLKKVRGTLTVHRDLRGLGMLKVVTGSHRLTLCLCVSEQNLTLS